MDNAREYSCAILYKPRDTKYLESIRAFQGCPTVAVTKGGRIYTGWYAGGTREPHMNNYNLLIYSDDDGKTWSEPLIVIPSNYEKNIHALDIQHFIDPDERLHVMWVQNNAEPTPQNKPEAKPGQPLAFSGGYMFNDFRHSEWEIICENPDDENPKFTQPGFVFHGFMRCKPTFLKNGDWICFAYDQLNDRYGYSISTDKGKTYTHFYGPKKKGTYFDETMAYELNSGEVRMLARTSLGKLAQCFSKDNGRTWTDSELSDITAADSRFFVSRLPSGNIILINNDDPKSRTKMTVHISDDDGKTWKYKKCIDDREDLSYPDADFHNGKIYLTYDCGRTKEREIMFAAFTEEDIIKGCDIPVAVISKPRIIPSKEEITKAVCEHKIIAILRNIPSDKLIRLAKALYNGGIRLLEITFNANGDVSDADVAKNISLLTNHFKDKMYIGAGTVLTAEQVRLARSGGASYIISPNVNADVANETHLCSMVYMPGALTPTEIQYAHELGAGFVKLFPISNLGTAYVKAVKAPLSHIKLLAVGGINTDNMRQYLDTGVCGFGIGASMTPKNLIYNDDYEAITELAKKYVSEVK